MPITTLPARGRPGLQLLMSVERELTAQDLLRLVDGSKTIVAPPPVQKLRSRHHRTAELLARGKTIAQVATETGYTPQRIRDMRQHDPSFQEILAHYESEVAEAVKDSTLRMQATLIDIAEMATDEIVERLEDPMLRRDIPVNELRQLAGTALDRTIAPPKTAQPITTSPTTITFVMPGSRDIRPQEIGGPVIEHDEKETTS